MLDTELVRFGLMAARVCISGAVVYSNNTCLLRQSLVFFNRFLRCSEF